MTTSTTTPRVRGAAALFMAVVLAMSGCATFGGPSYPDVAGSWQGGVAVEGQGIDGVLEMVQEGPELDVVFDAPSFGLNADGEGTVAEDGTARIFLDYDLQCPGRAELVGAFTDDATRFSGNVTAVDCTGEIRGTFSFRR